MKWISVLILLTTLLACESSKTDFEQDKASLEQLFQEIEKLSLSENCINENDWKFVGYGAKACGGFQGYIAYSSAIDEAHFLNLVDSYTAQEKAFNEKWAVISDCALVNPPKSISCQNNLPVFNY